MAAETALTAKVDGSAVAGLALAAAGARHMFGVVGIPVTSVASRAAAAGVRILAFRNEQSAGYAAAAYGFLTGSPGLLLTVSGPGCVHGLAGLSHATANAWPVLMISGSCAQADVGRGDFQELDQIAATKPFVKLAVKATAIVDIPRLVFQALAATVSGRPGGCYLDIPSDVLHQTLTQSEADALIAAAVADAAASGSSPPKHKSLEGGIEKAAELLHRAERPLVVFGKGAAYARAEEAIQKLVDTTGIPFLPTPMGKGVVPDAYPLSATAARSLAIGQCDVALIVGARLNWLLHFGEPPKWSKDVKFILVGIDEDGIELRKPHLGLVGDAKRVVELINREIKDQPFCLARSHPWVDAITKKSKDNVLKMEAQLAKDVVPFKFMTPLRIIRDAILAEGSPAPVVVSEGANTMDVGRAVLVQNEPRTRLDAGTWGTMGVGLADCIAAAVAEPKRLVVAVEGDSGFGFSAMEVEDQPLVNIEITDEEYALVEGSNDTLEGKKPWSNVVSRPVAHIINRFGRKLGATSSLLLSYDKILYPYTDFFKYVGDFDVVADGNVPPALGFVASVSRGAGFASSTAGSIMRSGGNAMATLGRKMQMLACPEAGSSHAGPQGVKTIIVNSVAEADQEIGNWNLNGGGFKIDVPTDMSLDDAREVFARFAVSDRLQLINGSPVINRKLDRLRAMK